MPTNASTATHLGEVCTLSPDGAFVVQLTSTSRPAAGGCRGRVEHVTSGVWSYFDSLDELVAFIDDAQASRTSGAR